MVNNKLNISSKIPKNRYLEDFLSYLEVEKGRSANTIENYRFYLTRFFDWVIRIEKYAPALNPKNINLLLINRYRIYLNRLTSEDGEPLKKNTQNYHLIALRSFLKFLAKREIKSLAPEAIELAKVGERSLDLITKRELDLLLSAPKGEDLKSLRDKAILELLFSTGLRVSELCSLGSDIDLTSPEISVR